MKIRHTANKYQIADNYVTQAGSHHLREGHFRRGANYANNIFGGGHYYA